MSAESSSPARRSSEAPQARVKRHWGLFWVWAVPLAALGLVAYLGYTYWVDRGPLITITFGTAEGISPHKTEVRYKAVTLGTVQQVKLSDDASHVIVQVRMHSQAEPMLNEGTSFWVVRPRLSGGLSGLGKGLKTLVSGSYLAMDPGEGGEFKDHFEGLEEPPSVRSGQPGSVFFLEADTLGSIEQGAPVYFQDILAGEVLSYNISLAPRSVRFRVFIEAPYDELVVEKTRFWRASGIGVETTSRGLTLELQSVRSLFLGGIEFDTSTDTVKGNGDGAPRSTFELHESRSAAMVTSYESVPYVTYFQGSVQGLTRGAQVNMYGLTVGAVTDVSLTPDPRAGQEGKMAVRVSFVTQPRRLFPEGEGEVLHHEGMRLLAERGMRVVLASQNMLTGQKALSLEHTASPESVTLPTEGDALVLPGEVQGLEQVTSALSAIANDVNRIPFDAIGNNLNQVLVSVRSAVEGPELEQAIVELHATLQETHSLVEEARSGLRPALERLPAVAEKLENAAAQAEATMGREGYGANSTLHRNLERMTDQIAEAAHSIQLLADFLNRQPEAFLRGRDGENKE